MVKEFPYAGFSATDSTRDEPAVACRQRAAALIERARQGQSILTYKLSGAAAWLLYRAADLLDKARL
jgi:hypothetical protein